MLYFIVNELSGKGAGKIAAERIRERLGNTEYVMARTEYHAHAIELARDFSSKADCTGVVAVGGDGSRFSSGLVEKTAYQEQKRNRKRRGGENLMQKTPKMPVCATKTPRMPGFFAERKQKFFKASGGKIFRNFLKNTYNIMYKIEKNGQILSVHGGTSRRCG